MMRKLLGIRLPSRTRQLYLDSDMLFFQRPLLLESLHGKKCFYMHDHGENFYLRPEAELSRICGFEVPARVNAGIVELNDLSIDWNQVEFWCGHFTPLELGSFLFEQTLTAMLVASQGGKPLPANEYAIVYNSTMSEPPEAVMLHYLYRAKLRLFSKDWKKILPAHLAESL